MDVEKLQQLRKRGENFSGAKKAKELKETPEGFDRIQKRDGNPSSPRLFVIYKRLCIYAVVLKGSGSKLAVINAHQNEESRGSRKMVWKT